MKCITISKLRYLKPEPGFFYYYFFLGGGGYWMTMERNNGVNIRCMSGPLLLFFFFCFFSKSTVVKILNKIVIPFFICFDRICFPRWRLSLISWESHLVNRFLNASLSNAPLTKWPKIQKLTRWWLKTTNCQTFSGKVRSEAGRNILHLSCVRNLKASF